ncbi:hypothetical protein ACQP2T_63590 (plasmid) [Nonomuraea sp. CA-143628]|uniref:hypothetical protein n=1 Tax=Nonomuraea sp. CA-143628 TaxID=3239997 RepID=UPI003D90AB17
MMARRMRVVEQEQMPQVGGGLWVTHGLPSLFPFIMAVVWGVLVEGAHLAWGGSPLVTPLVAIVFFAIGGCLTVFGYVSAGPRKHLRIAVTASGAAMTINLLLGLVFGFVTRDFTTNWWLISAYVICMLGVCPLWLIWRWTKYAGSTTPAITAGDETGASVLVEMARDARTKIHKPRMDERGVIRAKVSAQPGGTMGDAQALVEPLAAAARAVPGGASLIRNLDVEGEGEIEIATRDNLKAPIPWPGLTPELRGILPTDWFSLGEYQSGPVRVRIVGDVDKDRSAPDVSHLKVGGVTGSGKSTGAQAMIGSVMGMRRLTTIGVDVSTELQILGPFKDGFTIPPITDYELAKAFIHRMNKVVIPGLKAHLAREGLKRWSPKSSLNLMMVVFEESKAFGRLQKAYHDMVADARAAGVWIVSSTQSWLWRNLSTDVRKQHPSGWCFGMSEPDDVATVLPEEAVAALGDKLPTWGDRRPGYSYLAWRGVPERMWPKMLRAYDPLREQLLQAVELGAPYRDPMDSVTKELFGDLFADHVRQRGPMPVLVGRPVPRDVAAEHQFDGDDDETNADDLEAEVAEEHEEDRREVFDDLAEVRRRDLGDLATPADLEDVDADQPIPELGAVNDEESNADEVALTTEQAQRVWDEKLDELWRSGGRRLTTDMLTTWLEAAGRKRPFLYRQRDRWQAAGCIVPRSGADGWDLIASPLEAALVGPPHGE